MAKAIVVICPHRPDVIFGQPILGHVGWGYEDSNGSWIVGAIEGDTWDGGNHFNGFWAKRVSNLNDGLNVFANMKYDNGAEYDFYKLLTVTGVNPNPSFAYQILQWVSTQKYDVIGRNCMDSAYDILTAFSQGQFNNNILPKPKEHPIPNDWFNNIVTNEYYKLPDLKLNPIISASTSLGFNAANQIDAPSWRQPGQPDFIDTTQSDFDRNIAVPEPMLLSPYF